MYRILTGLMGLSLAGCATVNVYPTEIAAGAQLTESQSKLRAASDAFCDMTEEKGWVAKSQGLLQVAQSIFDGKAASADSTVVYSNTLDLDERDPAEVIAAVAADSRLAAQELAAVNTEARAFLDASETEGAARADVMSYERTLVWAQKSHRAFAYAVDSVSRTGGLSMAEVDAALTELAVEIDETRKLADMLAARYAGIVGDGA